VCVKSSLCVCVKSSSILKSAIVTIESHPCALPREPPRPATHATLTRCGVATRRPPAAKAKTTAGHGSTQFTHYNLVGETLFPNTRRMLHALHSERAALEYLPEGFVYPKYHIAPGIEAFRTVKPAASEELETTNELVSQ
jgi:hypothetical protein